jgi:hypothetical protein
MVGRAVTRSGRYEKHCEALHRSQVQADLEKTIRSLMHGEAQSITAISVANPLPRPAVEAALVAKPDSFLVAPSKIIINRHNASR